MYKIARNLWDPGANRGDMRAKSVKIGKDSGMCTQDCT